MRGVVAAAAELVGEVVGRRVDCEAVVGAADLVKKDLARAKITRADLTRDDEHSMPFNFHGLRHTAITHWAVAGQPLFWLLAVAGHTDAEMTRRYLDRAAVIRSGFGRPHAPLPASVLGASKVVLLAVQSA